MRKRQPSILHRGCPFLFCLPNLSSLFKTWGSEITSLLFPDRQLGAKSSSRPLSQYLVLKLTLRTLYASMTFHPQAVSSLGAGTGA